MALSDDDVKPAEGRTTDGRTREVAPGWVGGLFLFGLLLLYPGLTGESRAGSWLEPFGVGLALLATGLRAVKRPPQAEGKGSLTRLLVRIQTPGLIGGVLALLTRDWGLSLAGLESNSPYVIILNVAAIIAISVSGLSLLFAEVALQPMRDAGTIEIRRVTAAAVSGASLALAGTDGALLVYAASQTEAQADFSYFKTSEPGEATVKLVQSLATPVEVTGFFPEVSQVRDEVQRYLSTLRARSGNLEFAIADRYLQPKKAQELSVTQEGTLVLKHGENSRNLYIGTDIDKVRSKLVALDKEFNGRLNKLARAQHVAYLTVGHGELNDIPRGSKKAAGRTGTILRQLLEQQNYRVRDLGLSQGLSNQVPEDADLVLVVGPSIPFTAEEIGTLKRYADSGGKVFMALDVDSVLQSDDSPARTAALPVAEGESNVAPSAEPDTNETPTTGNPRLAWLIQLAAAVGADFEPTLLADESKHVIRQRNSSDHALLQTNRFSTHASVSTLSLNSTRAGIVAFGASHLRDTRARGYHSDTTVRTYSSAFADKNRNYKLDNGEKRQVYNLGMALTTTADAPSSQKFEPNESKAKQESRADAKEPKQEQGMRAFIFSDADAFSDLVLSHTVNNRILALDAIRWLVGDESLAGEVESEEDVTIETSESMDTTWFYLTIFGLPALVLVLGLLLSQRAQRPSQHLVGAQ